VDQFCCPEVDQICWPLTLGGLVGITAGCAFVDTWAAVVIGMVCGILVYWGVGFIEKKLKLDDVVGAVSVHGLCGVWGTIAVGLFDMQDGLFYSWTLKLVGVQIIGVLTCFVWTVVSTYLLIKIISMFAGGLRVSREAEIMGLNYSEHGAGSGLLDTMRAIQRVIETGDVSNKIERDDIDDASELIISVNNLFQELRQTAEIADQIANGNLDIKIIPKSKQDILGNALKKMIENLKKMIGKFIHASQEIEKTVKTLNTSAVDLDHVNHELLSSVEHGLRVAQESIESAQIMKKQADNGHIVKQEAVMHMENVRTILDNLMCCVSESSMPIRSWRYFQAREKMLSLLATSDQEAFTHGN
jgi:hypothetical protein